MSLELRPEVAAGTYSNLAIITHSHSEFIIDFANDFLQDVFKSNNAACTTKFIYHNGDMHLILLELSKQIIYLLGFRNEIRRTYQTLPTEITTLGKMWQ